MTPNQFTVNPKIHSGFAGKIDTKFFMKWDYLKDIYIFDLDGTLANIQSRVHLIRQPNPDWGTFYRRCKFDSPIRRVLDVATALHISGASIWVWTGRSSEVTDQTIRWLAKYANFDVDMLLMRAAGDHTKDDVLKQKWIDSVPTGARRHILGVFEDRQRVVDMWRENGVQCFQVAPGEF